MDPAPAPQTPPIPEPSTPVPPVPDLPVGRGLFDAIRRTGVRRSASRQVGGVAGGLAARMGWHPGVIQVAFVLLALCAGVGFVAYGIAWALLPEPDGRIHTEEALAGRFNEALLGCSLFILIGGTQTSGAFVWIALLLACVLLARAASANPAPATTPAPAPAPAVTVPKSVRRPHASGALVGAVCGATLLVVAATLARAPHQWPAALAVTLAASAVTVVVGVAVIICGARGRTAGLLALLGVLAAATAGAGLALTPGVWLDQDAAAVTQGTWTPTTKATATHGLSVGMGDVRVDLTQLPTSKDALTVPVQVGVGDLTIVVPRDAAVTARVALGAGNLVWDVDRSDTVKFSAGVGMGSTGYQSAEVLAGAAPTLNLDLELGAGQVTVVEETR